jgi:hypothetical protein
LGHQVCLRERRLDRLFLRVGYLELTQHERHRVALRSAALCAFGTVVSVVVVGLVLARLFADGGDQRLPLAFIEQRVKSVQVGRHLFVHRGRARGLEAGYVHRTFADGCGKFTRPSLMVLRALGAASFEHPFDLGLLRVAELDLIERRY